MKQIEPETNVDEPIQKQLMSPVGKCVNMVMPKMPLILYFVFGKSEQHYYVWNIIFKAGHISDHTYRWEFSLVL